MKVFVTGHKGYIGAHLVDVLRSDGHHVTVFELAGSSRRVYDHDGITVLSPVHDPLGNDIQAVRLERYAADQVP